MGKTGRIGTKKAHHQFSALLNAAKKDQPTIITRHGRAIAALIPIDAYSIGIRQESMLPLIGSSRGLWGKNSARMLCKWRDEWSR